ncbi:MAG: DUF2313 domain-containing protein [Butyricicoccus sp.]|nr:DUF2313 domain-containing protein [Butyricicoccus sp.]
MGYAEYLKDLLRPLRLYELDSGAGGAELECEGAALDTVCERLERALEEGIVASARDAGLSAYEGILPFVPSYITAEDRRRAVEALLRIDMRSFTCEDINGTVSGCGIRAHVEETGTAQTVRVSFPFNRGVPDGFDAVRERIEQILPCHLGVEYVFVRAVWREVEEWFESWQELEARCPSWDGLERYLPG